MGRGRTTQRALDDTSAPVLVLKLVRNPLHHGALGILRTLGRLGVPVFVVRQDRWEPLRLSRYERGGPLCEDGVLDDGEIVARLLDWSERLEQRAILVAIDDRSLILVEEFGDLLGQRFVFPRQPPGLARALSSKRRLFELCREHGVPAPETMFPADEEQAREFAGRTSYPVVVKRIDYFAREARRGPKMAIVPDRAQLLEAFATMRTVPEPGLMLQEYIPGGTVSSWMFDGYFDAASRCLFGLTGQKLRQHPVDTGVATLGLLAGNERVRTASIELLSGLGYAGIVDLGFRFDARDGAYKLLDVNPRVGCTFRLFVDAHGMDVVEAMYRDLTGQPVAAVAPVEGRRWIVENYDTISSLELILRRRLRVRDWLRSLTPIAEATWLARDDPLPFLGMLAASVAAALRRLRTAIRIRLERPSHPQHTRTEASPRTPVEPATID